MDKTKEYGSYSITFKNKIDTVIAKEMQENDDLYHLKIEGNKIEFYTPKKSVFFDIIKKSLEHELLDLEINSFKLKDVFLAQVKKI